MYSFSGCCVAKEPGRLVKIGMSLIIVLWIGADLGWAEQQLLTLVHISFNRKSPIYASNYICLYYHQTGLMHEEFQILRGFALVETF